MRRHNLRSNDALVMALLLVLAPVLATGVLQENCSTCITRSWGCDARCRPSNQAWDVDFRYREGRCSETIPLSNGVVQVDTDIWCAAPHTNPWGWVGAWFGKEISCHTMHKQPPRPMISAMSCSETTDLVNQKCTWHCKHRRPVSRCFLSFDATGKYRMQQNLEKCSVQEKCWNGKIKAKVTCASKPIAEAGLMGVMNVTVLTPRAFLAQRNLHFAFQDALAHMVPEVDLGVISVDVSSNASAVQVRFNASVTEAPALLAQMALENLTKEELVEEVNGALSSEGLEVLAEAVTLEVNVSLGTSEDFFEIVTMMRTYQRHLEEVRSELEEIQQDLEVQNLSQRDAGALREKQRSTQQRLSQIMSSQREMSEYIEDTIARRRSASQDFSSAWNRSQATAAELAAARANLSSTKEQLAALRQQHFQAEQSALEALKKQGELHQRLKANATRLARSVAVAQEELEELQEQYLDVQEDHTDVKQELRAARAALHAELADHAVTREELQAAETRQSTAYVVMSVALGCMAIALFGLASVLLVCVRRMKDAAVAPLTENPGQNVVVGWPVEVDEPVKGPTLLTSSALSKCMGSPMRKPTAF